jgi:small subunit ribosomal protein S1
MAQMTMAELLAKNDSKRVSIIRGQEVEGEIITILDDEVILDLGAKAEGILRKTDIPLEQVPNLKIGDKLTAHVLSVENEAGQVMLGLQKALSKGTNSDRFSRFETAQRNKQVLTGRGLEVNKGGLIVEVSGIRGFLPSSQVNLSQVGNLEDLIGKDIQVLVIEIDPSQNRLIFTQKISISPETKAKLEQLQPGTTLKGKVKNVLPFGLIVTLENGIEGLVHISEISWDKVEDANTLYKAGDEVSSKVVSIDLDTGKVNISIKQLLEDPFSQNTEKYQPDDVVQGTVSKISAQGINVTLSDGLEGFIPAGKVEEEYEVGQEISCIVDSVDAQRRKINLTPFITSTKDLIYK